MRFFFFVSSVLLAVAFLIAKPLPTQNPDKNPAYDVSILIDGKPIDPIKGIPASAGKIAVTGRLTPKSMASFPQLKSKVAIHKVVINLIRDTRRVGFMNWTGKESLASLSKQAQTGDRYVLQFPEVSVETKDGKAYSLSSNKLIQCSVY